MDRSAHYKSAGQKKSGNHFCRKSYLTLADKGNQKFQQKFVGGKEINRGGAHNLLKCFKCGELGQCANECKIVGLNCFKCRKIGHRIAGCRSNVSTCYNYGKKGHIKTQCHKPTKMPTTTA